MTEGLVHHLTDRLIRPHVDASLVNFFCWWNAHGPFPLTIPSTGGVRTDARTQAELFAKGRTTPGPRAGEKGYPKMGLTITNAQTLAQTPHGRRAAVDAYPAIIVNGKVAAIYSDDRDPKVLALFDEYGRIAEANGLRWGGRFKRKDRPHVEVLLWKSMPMHPHAPGDPL